MPHREREPVELRQVGPLDRAAMIALVENDGAALLEGWSDEPGWRTLLPWPERVVELPWSRAVEWPKLIDEITADAPQNVVLPTSVDHAPFLGGWVGYLAYEAGALSEAAPPRGEAPPEPPGWFALHRSGIVAAPDGSCRLFAPRSQIDAREGELAAARRPAAHQQRKAPGAVEDSLPGDEYIRRVAQIREAIAAGDVYQVNLTRRFRVTVEVDPRDLYAAMTRPDPPRCSALIRGSGWTIVSASPEVFLRFDRTARTAESRPIKGTIARAGSDDAEIDQLLASAKDDSEHLMIVDLVRNDLGRVAPAAHVSVPSYKEVRTLRHVHHLESTVRADGLEDRSLTDLLTALFPAGSITGAPKRAAVHAIRELEPVARGVYTGAIGYLDDRGHTELSVAIRTAVVTDREARYHAGGGIVWDSDPVAEEAECRAKSVAFLDYFGAER